MTDKYLLNQIIKIQSITFSAKSNKYSETLIMVNIILNEQATIYTTKQADHKRREPLNYGRK